MHPIPAKLKQEILNEPEYKVCMRRMFFKDHYCRGRITLEHTEIYGGKQIQEKFAIISLCEYAHSVDNYQNTGILDKEKNKIIAYSRANEKDRKKYPRLEWKRYSAYAS